MLLLLLPKCPKKITNYLPVLSVFLNFDTYHCVKSDLFLAASLHPFGKACHFFHYHFQVELSQLIIFFRDMWPGSQIGKHLPSNSFLKIHLSVWEPGHPIPSRSVSVRVRVCISVLSTPVLTFSVSVILHTPSLHYPVTKITTPSCTFSRAFISPLCCANVCVCLHNVSASLTCVNQGEPCRFCRVKCCAKCNAKLSMEFIL